jgi:glycosyltransferase involved in cell wall biosynthesis
MIKFGIYTTFYNCERFVDSIFSSIEKINYENFEWHITDDFSPDRTKELVLERLDRSPLKHKIKYFDQTEKKEMYWKPNLFFDPSFEWIVLVDADDDFDRNFLIIYNSFLEGRDDLSLVSSDCFKIYENDKSLHSISFLINDDKISNKIKRYHPSCDYLNNLSYSCFGLLRGFKNIIDEFKINDNLACAEDSYHVFWSNSYGKYLHIPRPLYVWHLREDSESHSKSMPQNFNANFEIALDKLKSNDGGVDNMFNDIYIETSSLESYQMGELKGKSVSLWTRSLSEGNQDLLKKIYFDSDLGFNDPNSEVHVFSLNFLDTEKLSQILHRVKGKKVLFYYQNQNYHETSEERDLELQKQLDKYTAVIGNHFGYSWWTYIRHFIIRG